MIIQYWEPMITQYWEYGDITQIPKVSKTKILISQAPGGFSELIFIRCEAKLREQFEKPPPKALSLPTTNLENQQTNKCSDNVVLAPSPVPSARAEDAGGGSPQGSKDFPREAYHRTVPRLSRSLG